MKRIEILGADGAVTNTIVADEELAQRYYPNRWRVVPEPVPVNPAPEEPQ